MEKTPCSFPSTVFATCSWRYHLPVRCQTSQRAWVSGATGAPSCRLRRRWQLRRRRAHHGAVVVGSPWPAGCRGESAWRQQQSRHRGGRSSPRRRLHARPRRRRERNKCNAVREAELQLHRRSRTGCGPRPLPQCHDGEARLFPQKRFPSSSPMRKQTLATSTTRLPAEEPRNISPLNCSR
jgi:hypothetical protein